MLFEEIILILELMAVLFELHVAFVEILIFFLQIFYGLLKFLLLLNEVLLDLLFKIIYDQLVMHLGGIGDGLLLFLEALLKIQHGVLGILEETEDVSDLEKHLYPILDQPLNLISELRVL